MQIKFHYSWIYNEMLNRIGQGDYTWDEVKKYGEEFETKYKNEIKQIVEVIPEVVGKPWSQDYMDVYLVSYKGPSFSKPLTLKVREDQLLMLVILTHELLHYFYVGSVNEPKKMEVWVNANTHKVFELLGIEASEQLKTLKKHFDERFDN